MEARQTAIACRLMRGGTSKGALFLAGDLPGEVTLRDRVLLAAMGSPDARQIDGLGGAQTLSSQVAIVSRSARPGTDVECLFAQVAVDQPLVDLSSSCGDLLAAIAPFAIDRGLLSAGDPTTSVTLLLLNDGRPALVTVETPGGQVHYEGQVAMVGVPGTGAPIYVEFPDTAGSAYAALLPSHQARDRIADIELTCIDHGDPAVLIPAHALGKSGYESVEALDADVAFRARLERLRLAAGVLMGLGDVSARAGPSMILIAAPRAGGLICTREFRAQRCQASIGLRSAISVASACALPGSVAADIAPIPSGSPLLISLEHPSGALSARLELAGSAEQLRVVHCSLVLTARALMDGNVLVPHSVWDGARYFGR
jgi:4-oxalomesaconate tautomerase